MKDLIKRLTEAFGPSGFEYPVRELIAAEVKELADEVRTDAMGNLIVLKKGRNSKKKVMLAAHMDEIGVMVSHVDEEGFLRFIGVGSVRELRLTGARVQFANGMIGVIDVNGEDLSFDKVPDMGQLFIDVGARDEESCPLKVGDVGVFTRPCVAQDGRVIAKALDNRMGCVLLIEALRGLTTPAYDSYFVFTTQEEVGMRGAFTSAYGVDPDYGIAVDGAFTGDIPKPWPIPIRLGGGPVILVRDSGCVSHPGFNDWMISVAEENQIPYQLQVLRGGGTDAEGIQRAHSGVVTSAISFPMRHIHSSSEMVDLKDAQAWIALVKALLEREIPV